ncbi:hypothetical protein D3C86_1888990 [compost metagenome]
MLPVVIKRVAGKDKHDYSNNGNDDMGLIEPHKAFPFTRTPGKTAVFGQPLIFSLLNFLLVSGIQNELDGLKIRFICGDFRFSVQ